MQEHLLESFDYLAPEYIAGVPVDARVDIYGLGCVLYEALTAEVPYPAATPAAKMYAHRASDPPSVRDRRPEVPEALDAVVGRAMTKDPAGRHRSAAEFAVEAAGAVGLPAPLWATSSPAHTAASEEKAVGPVTDAVATGEGAADALDDDGYYQPVYFVGRRPRAGRRVLLALGVLLFLAAPIALLLVLLIHGWS